MIGLSNDPVFMLVSTCLKGANSGRPVPVVAGSWAGPAPRLAQRMIAIGHAVETSWAIPNPGKSAGMPSARHAAPARQCHGPDLTGPAGRVLDRCSFRRSPSRLIELAIVLVIKIICRCSHHRGLVRCRPQSPRSSRDLFPVQIEQARSAQWRR